MVKTTENKIDQLLASARKPSQGNDPEKAEQAFFKALLDATVYAHVPIEGSPIGTIRFVQFVRPDNGQTVLPFFSDRKRAEIAADNKALIVSMSGRRLFELTQGATLMLNPNEDRIALYPPEVATLLRGGILGYYTRERTTADTTVLVGPPSVSTVELNVAMNTLFEREATIKAAFLTEVHRQSEGEDVFLLLTIVAAQPCRERLLHLVTLTFKSEALTLAFPLDVRFLAPDEPPDGICNSGVQIYGT